MPNAEEPLSVLSSASSFSSLALEPQLSLPAHDVTAADIKAFLDELPRDRVGDLPIRIVDAGTHRVRVYGVFRPQAVTGAANVHEVARSEVYYMLEGGVGRRIVPGDIVVIPGGTPHWWSGLEGDIAYLIIGSDPDNVLPLR